jgi:hypothetical protein
LRFPLSIVVHRHVMPLGARSKHASCPVRSHHRQTLDPKLEAGGGYRALVCVEFYPSPMITKGTEQANRMEDASYLTHITIGRSRIQQLSGTMYQDIKRDTDWAL